MKAKKQIDGIVIAHSCREDHEIRSTITWIDIKIRDFLDRVNTNGKYAESRRALADFYEIMGALKTLYMEDVIQVEEFLQIIKNIAGEDVSREELGI